MYGVYRVLDEPAYNTRLRPDGLPHIGARTLDTRFGLSEARPQRAEFLALAIPEILQNIGEVYQVSLNYLGETPPTPGASPFIPLSFPLL